MSEPHSSQSRPFRLRPLVRLARADIDEKLRDWIRVHLPYQPRQEIEANVRGCFLGGNEVANLWRSHNNSRERKITGWVGRLLDKCADAVLLVRRNNSVASRIVHLIHTQSGHAPGLPVLRQQIAEVQAG